MNCQAVKYDSDCCGAVTAVDVVFKYRSRRGFHAEDETVKVCMCDYHREWLEKYYNSDQLEMRGTEHDYAIHDDLFVPFDNKNRVYTALALHYRNGQTAEGQYKFVLLNGKRDIESFKLASDADEAYELGVFQTCLIKDSVSDEYVETVIMLKPITMVGFIDALADGAVDVYYTDAAYAAYTAGVYYNFKYSSREEHIKYTADTLPNSIHLFFTKERYPEEFEIFEECLFFIEKNIENFIIDWESICDKSPHKSAVELFVYSKKLREALLAHDEYAIQALKDQNKLTEDVLWVTYISANHKLFWSNDESEEYTLKHSIRLTKLFIAHRLEKKLLILAISGERQRSLSIHARDSHDILYENVFVVKTLVPDYVGIDSCIAEFDIGKEEMVTLTPLEYFVWFSNKTYSICPDRWNEPYSFDKNEDICLYLQKCEAVKSAFEIDMLILKRQKKKWFCENYEKEQEKRNIMIISSIQEKEYITKNEIYSNIERIHEVEREILDEKEAEILASVAASL
jgi:hypothetical protein